MSLEEGCRTAVETCMGVKPEDKAVIIADKDSEKIAKKLKEKILEITPHVRYFNLDIYGERPISSYPDTMEKAATDATVTFWTAKSVEGELETVRMLFLKSAVFNGRHAHMVNINEEIVKTGLTGDYNKVEEFTNTMHSKVKKVDKIKIKSDAGTDLEAEVGKYKWIATTGILHEPGEWHNLPDGMVYTVPQSMRGKAVIDGTLGDYFDDVYSLKRIEESPLKISIKDGRPPRKESITCDDKEIERDIREYIGQAECSSYLGELGFGTNLYVDELIGSILVDEKAPGVHIAFGDPNQNMTMAGWTCKQHIDMVMQNCDVWLDGEKVMEDGDYLEKIL